MVYFIFVFIVLPVNEKGQVVSEKRKKKGGEERMEDRNCINFHD